MTGSTVFLLLITFVYFISVVALYRWGRSDCKAQTDRVEQNSSVPAEAVPAEPVPAESVGDLIVREKTPVKNIIEDLENREKAKKKPILLPDMVGLEKNVSANAGVIDYSGNVIPFRAPEPGGR